MVINVSNHNVHQSGSLLGGTAQVGNVQDQGVILSLFMKNRIKSKEILIQLVWYLRWKRKRQIVVLQKVGENLGKILGKISSN